MTRHQKQGSLSSGGVALLALGCVLLLASTYPPLATVIFANVMARLPSGTLTEPSGLVSGASLTVLLALDAQVDPATVTCSIHNMATNTYEDLPLTTTKVTIVYQYYNTWIVPNVAVATMFRFEFKLSGIVVATTYGQISEINGYFTINQNIVSENTVMIVTSSTVYIEFYSTTNGQLITSVSGDITRETTGETTSLIFTEVTQDYKWVVMDCYNGNVGQGYITLPGPGTYTLVGRYGTGGAVLHRNDSHWHVVYSCVHRRSEIIVADRWCLP